MAAIQHYPHAHLRHTSPYGSQGFHSSKIVRPSATKQELVSDSDSDDEPPPALKFSKVTEALLNDRLLPSSPIKYSSQGSHRPLRSVGAFGSALATPDRRPGIKILRQSSPSALGGNQSRGHTPPRIVHVGSAQKGSARRTVSIAGPYPHRLASEQENVNRDIVTPARATHLFGSTRPRAGSNASQDDHRAGQSSSSRPASRNGHRVASDSTNARPHQASSVRVTSATHATDAMSRYTLASISRSRAQAGDQGSSVGSQRIKRAPVATGNFLKSGPVRRGFRRRESEDDVSPTDEYNNAAASQPSSNDTPEHGHDRSDGLRSHPNSISTRATSVEPLVLRDTSAPSSSRPGSRQDEAQLERARADDKFRPLLQHVDNQPVPHTDKQRSLDRKPISLQPSSNTIESRLRQEAVPTPVHDAAPLQRLGSINRPYRYVSEPHEDQENAPPPTFKRNREHDMKGLDRITTATDTKQEFIGSRTPISPPRAIPDRKALHAISNNTPHRAAPPPPPPKMTVLDTATTTAGASTTKSRKKRTHIVINGKIFTQMGRIGKGGSSEVYLVMAENYKTFALKKVRLDNCDESAVRGFKGEIDLLKKLTEVDRVIRLYDWELNEEKQELLVLMEKGDTDLYRIMTLKNGGHDGKFDLTFTRYYWKEMLECVQAVHDHDIVHSDLKPANFLIVQGRLKLIDFGIANAIEVDHTCNVHRDSHVGTPNYMSPESINDTSGGTGRDAQGRPLRKDMKIGKSSDVWSLGCILYQMTYGRPPFAHIPTIPRIMAITNPKHIIEFPDTGIGGVVVPSSLKGVLKRCLQREVELRPTIPQLLSDTNDFLHREANGAVMMRQDVLEHIINKVVDRCQDTKRGMPSASEVAQYAPDFMAKIRAMNERV